MKYSPHKWVGCHPLDYPKQPWLFFTAPWDFHEKSPNGFWHPFCLFSPYGEKADLMQENILTTNPRFVGEEISDFLPKTILQTMLTYTTWKVDGTHVLVYHGPLLIHLLGVASHLPSLRCIYVGTTSTQHNSGK